MNWQLNIRLDKNREKQKHKKAKEIRMKIQRNRMMKDKRDINAYTKRNINIKNDEGT